MSYYSRIKKNKLSSSEKAIVDFLEKNPFSVFELTTTELAEKSFTSAATIVRFCKKLGYNGYEDFKIQYFNDLKHKEVPTVDPNFPVNIDDQPSTIAKKMKKLYEESVSKTFESIDIDQLSRSARLLFESRSIFLFGNLNNELFLRDFQLKCERIGKRCISSSTSGGQLLNAINATSDDCALIVSFTGETEELLNVATICQTNNVPMILISSNFDSNLATDAIEVIELPHDEVLYPKLGVFSSKVSINYILDTLYLLLFNCDYSESLKNYYLYSSKLGIVKEKMRKAMK